MVPPSLCALAGPAKALAANPATRKIGASLRARISAFIGLLLQTSSVRILGSLFPDRCCVGAHIGQNRSQRQDCRQPCCATSGLAENAAISSSDRPVSFSN